MTKSKSVDEQMPGLSRRAIMKSASAAVASLAFAAPALAACTQPTLPIDYGTDTIHGQTPLDECSIFPLLAGWIVLTANGSGHVPVTVSTLMTYAKLSPTAAKKLFELYNSGTYGQSFTNVQKAFHDLLTLNHWANAAPYSGGQCPDHPETIQTIAQTKVS
jgi:hypothetical protein